MRAMRAMRAVIHSAAMWKGQKLKLLCGQRRRSLLLFDPSALPLTLCFLRKLVNLVTF
jgi:hypothetical protein